jgi:hypothetical protein
MNYEPGKETEVQGRKVIPIHSRYCISVSNIPCEFRERSCNIACGSFMFLSEANYAKHLAYQLTGRTS